jgi:hypothetical protein
MMMRWAEQKQAVSKLGLPCASAAYLLGLFFYLEDEGDTSPKHHLQMSDSLL